MTTIFQNIETLKLEIERDDKVFEAIALKVFKFQAIYCRVYKSYLSFLKVNPNKVTSITEIPFLPISFFKTQPILADSLNDKIVFESSGTTGNNTSQHLVASPQFYEKISRQIFENTYGPLENFHIIALLPSYLEKGKSSLVYMIDHFIKATKSEYSGFHLSDYQAIISIFESLKNEKTKNKKILLWGVTYALLDFLALNYDFSDFSDRLIVLETGGMKGRRKEMIREELYELLKRGFSVENIHSEYGMTELLSQAYSVGDAIFECPTTMQIVLREVNDPFAILPENTTKNTGGINVIDLANVESCSFIETQDLGQYVQKKGRFKVLGRFDNADLRGCNLLIS